jgi:predicted lipoprotein
VTGAHCSSAGRALPWVSAVLLMLASGCATAPATPADSLHGLGARLLRQYIQPRTRELATRTVQLHDAVREYCADVSDARRNVVGARMAGTAEAWAAVELLRFGPLVEQNRAEQFFFWPDPRGVVQRQMRAILASADAALLGPAALRAQSVAVQGLPALEYALHADEAGRVISAGTADDRYRCAYASAVAANLARLAGEIEAGWQTGAPLATEFARPAAGNNVYRSTGEVATEVLKALSTALHVAHDQKLQPALGDSAAEARGTLLPLYRSGVTQRYLVAGIDALAQFHAASRVDTALPAGSAWTDAGLRAELRRVREDLAAITGPLDRRVDHPEQRELLVHAALLLVNARAIVDEHLAPALGVNLGFNALDGD